MSVIFTPRTRASRSRGGKAASTIGSAMFSAAVSRGTRWKLWNTKPMRRLRNRACSSADSVVTSRPSST